MSNLAGGKTVKMTLVGVNGNAFALMGEFARNARKQGWYQEEIDLVLDECKSGNYNNLLQTLMNHIDDEPLEEISLNLDEHIRQWFGDSIPELIPKATAVGALVDLATKLSNGVSEEGIIE